MTRIHPSQIRALTQQLVQDGTLDRKDINTLLDAAISDKVLSPDEKKELREILSQHADKLDGPDTRKKLESFLSTSNASLRNLAHTLERDDGVINFADAEKLGELVHKDGKISGREKYSLFAVMAGSKLTDDARAHLDGIARGTGPTPPTPPTPPVTPDLELKLPTVAGQNYRLSAEGHLVTGTGGAARFDELGALSLYRSADALSQAEGVVLKDVPTAVKEKMLDHLGKAFAAGAEDAALPKVARERMRSGAATTLLALIEGCGADQADLRQKAVDTYLTQALQEPIGGLRASMYFNLERLEGTLKPDEKTRLAALKDAVIPSKPPYDRWFADGKREIGVKHYAHKECWDYSGDPVKTYESKGYKLVSSHPNENPPRWVLEKKNDQAPGGPVTMRVELMQTHDGIFSSMNDPGTDMILYTGHSNLGGNVSEELRLGTEEKSEKLILMAMCRGKQNMFEVANKYPNCNFVTTDAPSYFSSVMTMALGMTEGALKGQDYKTMREGAGWISDQGGKDNYFFPHEARRYALYDLDKDGVIDGRGATVDRLYDVGLSLPQGTKVDVVARPNDLVAEDIEGSKVQHAVQFMNTLMTYHVDHGHHTSAFKAKDMDAFLSGGWFDGPTDELVRLKTVHVDGKEMIRVQVNKALADQSWYSLGTLVQFETVKQLLKERNGGTLTAKDEARAALFAGEYLSYMYCSWDEAQGSLRGLNRYCEHLSGLSYNALRAALDTDGSGYVTDKQMEALLASNG